MANNTLTFSSPGTAKLSWKVKLGDKELENVDSLVLNINDSKEELDPETRERTVQINESTSFSLDAEYGEYFSRSNKLHVKIVSGGIFYGSLAASKSDFTEFGWEVIKSEIELFIDELTSAKIEELIDAEPVELDGDLVAHPGKLIKVDQITSAPYNKSYKFYCADDTVLESHPVLIYPASYGLLDDIKDAAGFEMYNKTTSSNSNDLGFMMDKMTIDGTEHYVYIQKRPNSSDADTGALIYTFNKK